MSKLETVRLQIRNQSKSQMVQVQNGRLHFNWLGHEGGEYPHYEEVREGFDHVWREFRAYVTEHSLGDLVPIQWEVTYVNHIPSGELWDSPEQWLELFRGLAPVLPATHAPVRWESFGSEWHYEIEPQRGRLHVSVGHGTRDNRQLLYVNLTARGPVDNQQDTELGLSDGLELGHRVAVQAFNDMTSDKAHRHWGLIK